MQRRRFTTEEDNTIKRLYKEGISDWDHIASHLEGRSAKQCKERYFNFLDPSVWNIKWTPEEDDLLREKVKVLGNKWNAISKFFPHRSPNNIKNRFHHCLIKEPWAEMCIVRKKKQPTIPPKRAPSPIPDELSLCPVVVDTSANLEKAPEIIPDILLERMIEVALREEEKASFNGEIIDDESTILLNREEVEKLFTYEELNAE